MTSKQGVVLALSAGTMAALGSVAGKLAFDESAIPTLCVVLLGQNAFQWVTMAVRSVCFMAIFGFNGLMWLLFTKSLQLCLSSVEATITNTSANFLVTALLGFVLFGESLSVRWWMGSAMIVCGLLLIHKARHKQKEE